MAARKLRSPDDNGSGGGSPTPPAKPNRQQAIPQADIDLGAVATAVAAKWVATPAITLVWTSSAAFSTLASQYNTALGSRITTGAQRPGHSYTLAQLDNQVNAAVEEVKTYIKKKFKSDGASAQYPRYGIIKEGANWRMPKDRDERRQALGMMVSAIGDDGFDTEEYGDTFWTEMQEAYADALGAANDVDSRVSTGVGSKNMLKKDVRKVIVAIRFALRANYPDTYEEQYRAWGLQKEDY